MAGDPRWSDAWKRAWANRIAAVAAIVAGVAAAWFLVSEPIPPKSGVELRVAVHKQSTRSACAQDCDHPEKTGTDATVTTESPEDASGGSALERALDNEAGVVLLRLLAAALLAATLGALTRQVVLGVLGGHGDDPTGSSARRRRPIGKGSGGEGAQSGSTHETGIDAAEDKLRRGMEKEEEEEEEGAGSEAGSGPPPIRPPRRFRI